MDIISVLLKVIQFPPGDLGDLDDNTGMTFSEESIAELKRIKADVQDEGTCMLFFRVRVVIRMIIINLRPRDLNCAIKYAYFGLLLVAVGIPNVLFLPGKPNYLIGTVCSDHNKYFLILCLT